jgi:hypothetical protein
MAVLVFNFGHSVGSAVEEVCLISIQLSAREVQAERMRLGCFTSDMI